MASDNGLLSIGKQVGDPFQEALSARRQKTSPNADPSVNTSEAIAKGRAASSPDLREKAEQAKQKRMREYNEDEDGNPLPTPSASPSPIGSK